MPFHKERVWPEPHPFFYRRSLFSAASILFSIDPVIGILAVECLNQIFRRLAGDRLLGLVGISAEVRREDHVVEREQRFIRRGRLRGEHVERRAGDLVILERFVQRSLVDHGAAAKVQQHGALFHDLELLCGHHAARFRRKMKLDRHIVRSLEAVIKRFRLLDPQLRHLVGRNERIVCHNVHVKCRRHLCHRAANAAKADDQQRLFRNGVGDIRLAELPVAVADRIIRLKQRAAAGQHEHHHVFCNGRIVAVGDIEHLDAVIRRGCNIDIVDAYAVLRHDLKRGAALKDLAGDGLHAGHHALDLVFVDAADERFLLAVRGHEGLAVFFDEVNAYGLDGRFDQQNAMFHISSLLLFFTHVGISDRSGRAERFLDRVGAEPADHVERGTRLIVGAGGTRAAERLLADDRAGAFIIDVEVTGGVAQGIFHLDDRRAVLREDRAGQGIGRSAVADGERLIQLVVIIDVDRNDGAKDLLDHGLIRRRLAADDRRLNEPALAVIIGAAGDELALGRGCGAVNVSLAGLKGGLVDHGRHERVELLHVADLQRGGVLLEQRLHLRPDARGNERARAGGALLALELERAADDRRREWLDIGSIVGEDEVLAARLADKAGIVGIGCDILADLLPHALENGGRAGEVEACHLGVADNVLCHIAARAGNEVDDASGQAAPHQKLHVIVVGQHRRAGGLPQRHIANDRRGRRQVAANGRKVKRGDRADKAIKWTVVLTVPDARLARRLILEDLLCAPHAKAQEVGKLGNIDLRLEHGLGLAKHRGGVQHLAVRAGDHIGGLQENGGAVLPGHCFPIRLRGEGGVDGHLELFLAGHAALGDDMLMIVRHRHFDRAVGPDLLAADDQGNLNDLGGLLCKLGFQLGALGAAGKIALKGIVCGFGNGEICVRHNDPSFCIL